jgi:Protein of unknown function (DUF1360)
MGMFRAYPADDARPIGGHFLLASVYGSGVAAAAYAHRRSGDSLPERVPASDLVLMSIATYKVSRLIAKDRITSFIRRPFTRYKGESDRPSEVSEGPRGEGFQRAVGELLVCPHCLSQWVGTGLLVLYLHDERLARTAAALFTIVSGSDLLQEAWVAIDKRV